MHATTGEVPAERLLIERARLQALAAAYGGRSVQLGHRWGAQAVLGYQHPLTVYDTLLMESRRMRRPAPASHIGRASRRPEPGLSTQEGSMPSDHTA